MTDFQLASPWFLMLALLAIPYVMFISLAGPTVAFSSVSSLADMPQTLRSRLTFVPGMLIVISILLFAIALARPQTKDDKSRISREGIAIMLVIDRSSSMNARDLEKDYKNINRLGVVKDVLHYFITGNDKADRFDSITNANPGPIERGRPDDMVGLVAFAGYADSLCPLTLDHGNLLQAINNVELGGEGSNKTAIGDGLGLAVERLRQSSIESRIVILLTDGVNNFGALDPLQAGDLAADENIKVYCIGAGTNGLAPYPMKSPFTGQTYLENVRVEIDEVTLESIAEKTGGKYFRATDKDALLKIYDEINQLEKSEITEVQYLKYHEHFHTFLIYGVLCLTVGWVLQLTVFQKVP